MRLSALRPASGIVAVLFIMAVLLAISAQAMTCVQGTIAATMSEDGVETPFCNSTACSITFSIAFNESTVDDDGPWPLDVQFADGSRGSELYPDGGFSDITFECDGFGDIIATSSAGPNNEQIQLIWNYATADSTNCASTLQSIDLAANFTVFQVLLSYSDSVSGEDALGSSTDAEAYSIAAVTIECPNEISTTATATTATTETTATTGTTSIDNNNSTTGNSTDDEVVTPNISTKKQRNIWMGLGITFVVVAGVLAFILLFAFVYIVWDVHRHMHKETMADSIRNQWDMFRSKLRSDAMRSVSDADDEYE